MMNRELLIEYTPDLVRVAVLEAGKLCEIHRERLGNKKQTDGLYFGRIQSIRPSVGAAFVDIGEPNHAFLPISDGSKYKCGDFVIVQSSAIQSVDTKGLRVSDKINLAGKWLVLVPGGHGVHVSKKIKDSELREALVCAVEPLCPADCQLIVRTASADVTETALQEEIRELELLWYEVQKKARGLTKPGLLHEPLDLVYRIIRDIGSTVNRVTVNDSQAAMQIESLRMCGWLHKAAVVSYFDESKQLLTDVFSLDAQVDKALKKRVWLDCGGYLIFDLCEAMTVIDVNSGKMVLGRDVEDTALRVNLEAAKEIARQLRLRDIGGMIIVDYIDLKDEKHREQLLQVIQEEVRKDRSQVDVLGITRLGLVEMTRKRKGEQLNKALQSSCKTCDGSGHFLSAEEIAFRILRQVRRMVISGQRGPFFVRCAAPVAGALSELTVSDGHHAVYVVSESARHFGRYEINQMDEHAVLPKGAVQLKW